MLVQEECSGDLRRSQAVFQTIFGHVVRRPFFKRATLRQVLHGGMLLMFAGPLWSPFRSYYLLRAPWLEPWTDE